MPSVVALRRYLVFVAGLRLMSVYIGMFHPHRLHTNLFDNAGGSVNDLFGRTFAMWTTLSCMLCLCCARNPCNKIVYGATLASFVIALLFFLGELCVFKTLGWRTALQPLVVALISAVWMSLGWNYYTTMATEMSEEIDSKEH